MAQSRTAYGGGRLSSCRVGDSVMRIAPGIHRIGGHSMINAYLVEQAGEVTIIDAGPARLLRRHRPGTGRDGPGGRRCPCAGLDSRAFRPHRLRGAAAARAGSAGVGSRGRRRAGAWRGAEPVEGLRPGQTRAAPWLFAVLGAARRASHPQAAAGSPTSLHRPPVRWYPRTLLPRCRARSRPHRPVAADGLAFAIFYTQVHDRMLRPSLPPAGHSPASHRRPATHHRPARSQPPRRWRLPASQPGEPRRLRDRPEPKTAETAVRSSDRRIASRSRSAARARPAPPLAFPGPRRAFAGSATRRARSALAAAGPVSGRRTRRRSRPRTAPR